MFEITSPFIPKFQIYVAFEVMPQWWHI